MCRTLARWRHGTVEAKDITSQINSMKLTAEGGSENCELRIKLCGEECIITFDEKHVVALQEFLKLYK